MLVGGKSMGGFSLVSTCELWKVVCLQQLVEGLLPVVLEHEVIEAGDDVSQGAPMGQYSL